MGDALAYPVEFLKEGYIFSKYGENGITEYEKDPHTFSHSINGNLHRLQFWPESAGDLK